MKVAIVLAGGYGTRLKTITDVPKPMVPVDGRPFLDRVLDRLYGGGFRDVVLSLHYKPEIFISHFKREYRGMKILYDVRSEALGTGGSIKAAMSKVVGTDRVFIINGDTFLDLNYYAFERAYNASRAPTIAVKKLSDTGRYGRISFKREILTGFVEKGGSSSGYINAGHYILPIDIFDRFPELGPVFSLERDFFEIYYHELGVRTFETEGGFIDIGVPEDYRFLCENPSMLET